MQEMVENIAWSLDCILITCEDSLRAKVRKQLVGMSVLETGVPFIIKWAFDLVLDVDDTAL